jgi:predicted NBD/HSP70 family sugar kinase
MTGSAGRCVLRVPTSVLLAAVVDFVNPAELVLGGALSRSPELVASVRTVVYDHALPLATRDLSVLVTRIGRDATTLGAASLALDEVFATLTEV